MLTMDYIYADNLTPDQVMAGDFIEFGDSDESEIGEVITVHEFEIGEKEYSYLITGRNEFHEPLEMIVFDGTLVKLFVFK